MKRHVDARLLVHATMLAFAGASLGNVHEFFRSAGHPGIVAWPLAVALGSALVTLSIMLTHVDPAADRTAFGWLLATALLLGMISGALQQQVYRQHLEWPWAVLLGYGIPLGGEVCLAFATSAYLKARGRERFRNVAGTVESAVADQLETALAAFDPALIQQHVEDTVNQLARQAIDSVAAQAMQFYQTDTSTPGAQEQPGGFGPHNLEKAQAARAESLTAQSEETKHAILDLLAEQGVLGASAIADALGLHRDTARKYAQELAADGLLIQENRKFRTADKDEPA